MQKETKRSIVMSPRLRSWLCHSYDAVFNGRHDKDLQDTGEPFQPSDRYLEEFLSKLSPLSEEAKAALVKNVSKEEIEDVVKSCPNGKAPGLDGLSYELYKSTWDIIGD